MKGWKTWVGVAGSVLTYIAADQLGVDMTEAGNISAKIITWLQATFGALTVVGLGHKIEKNGVEG